MSSQVTYSELCVQASEFDRDVKFKFKLHLIELESKSVSMITERALLDTSNPTKILYIDSILKIYQREIDAIRLFLQ